MELFEAAGIVIYVDNIEGATHFYRDILGLPPVLSGPGWVQLGRQDFSLFLREHSGGGQTRECSHVALRANDLDSALGQLEQQGLGFRPLISKMEFGRKATFQDPSGNEIELLEFKSPTTDPVTARTIVNDIIYSHPETMEIFEEHGIRICGGCLILLNSPVLGTAQYSGLSREESNLLVQELNHMLGGADSAPAAISTKA